MKYDGVRIRLWKSADKADGMVSSEGTTFDATVQHTMYAEGLGLSTAVGGEAVELQYLAGGAVPTKKLDTLKLTVYRVTGAMNVPGFTNHTYYAVAPGGTRPTFSDVNHVKSAVPHDDQAAAGYSKARYTVLWDEGSQVGKYKVTAPGGLFSVVREVNVVKIAFASGANDNVVQFDQNNVVVPTKELYINFESSNQANAPFMRAQLRVQSVSGPTVQGALRGERFIEMGWMQSIRFVHLRGDYNDDYRVTSNQEGIPYIDRFEMSNISGWAYAGNEDWRLRIATDAGVEGDEWLFKFKDSPSGAMIGSYMGLGKNGVPELKPIWPLITENGSRRFPSSYTWVQDFSTYFGVRTVEADNAAELSYTIRAERHWEIDASGKITIPELDNFGMPANVIFTPLGLFYRSHGGGPIPQSTSMQENQDGRIMPTELIAGISANTMAHTWVLTDNP